MLILEDLQKFGNYSIQVWAYTLAGDGVKSHAIYCLTDEDGNCLRINLKFRLTFMQRKD